MSRLIALFALVCSNTAYAQGVNFVDVDDFMFAPAQISVIEGDTVQWDWVGLASHSTTAAAGQSEFWDSGVSGPGTFFTHDFLNGAGVTNYFCIPHGFDAGGGQVGGMSGSVDVLRWSGVLMNEVLADPAPGADVNCDGVANTVHDEFVEIVNTTGGPFDLSGATLSDLVSVRHTFAPGTILAPGAAIVIFGGGTPLFDGTSLSADPWCQDLGPTVGIDVASGGSLGLNNGGDTLFLADAGGLLLDTFGYGGEGGNDEALIHTPELNRGLHDLHSLGGVGTWSPGTLGDGQPFILPMPSPTISQALPGIAGQQNQFEATNGPPSCNTVFIYGTTPGAQAFPLGLCPGVSLGIVGPTKFAEVMSDLNGNTLVSVMAPAGVAGQTYAVQAVYPCTCEVTNVSVTTFQ